MLHAREVRAGSRQAIRPQAIWESESSAWLAEQLEEASCGKALTEAGGRASEESDRHKTRADRQTGRQQPELDICSVVGARGWRPSRFQHKLGCN